MEKPLNEAVIFLINTLFNLYLTVLILRIILSLAHTNYFNPLSLFVIKLTQPIILPFRKLIPGLKRIEVVTFIIMLTLEVSKFLLISLVTIGLPHSYFGLLLLAFVDIIKLWVNVLFFAILAQAILSWVQMKYTLWASVLDQITSPIVRPFQRLIPPVAGIDLSLIPVLILLQLTLILILNPMTTLGMQLMYV